MKVKIHKFHKFLEDYDQRLENHYGMARPAVMYKDHLRHMKNWYGFDVEVDELGNEAYVEMTDQNYTLFALKYS